MKVEVIDMGGCRKQLRVELDASELDEEFERITSGFVREARLPGFRKGKAPRARVAQMYAKQIEEEVRRRVIPDTYRRAVQEEKLHTVVNPDIDEVEFGRGQNLKFVANVETAPDFELPDYQGIPIQQAKAEVTEDSVEAAIEKLREGRAGYDTVERAAADGDYLVVNYKGTTDGNPLTELAPTARGVSEHENFWVHVHADGEHDHFLPKFTAQLVGAKAGERREVTVEFPEEFPAQPKLQGVKALYDVEVVEVKVKTLPEVDDAFAKGWEAESVEKLREGVREDLAANAKGENQKAARVQVQQWLLENVTCDLPETHVNVATRSSIMNFVQSNQQMGMTQEMIEENKEDIFKSAKESAQGQVRLRFILDRIAENEKVEVTNEEFQYRVAVLAQQADQEMNVFFKKLQKNNQVNAVYADLVREKTIALLVDKAVVEEVDPETLPEEVPAAEGKAGEDKTEE